MIFQQKIRQPLIDSSERVSIASIHPELHFPPTRRPIVPLHFCFSNPRSTLSQRRLPRKQDSLSSPVTRPPRRHHPAVCSAQSRDCRKDRFSDPTLFANSTTNPRPTPSLNSPSFNCSESSGSAANTTHSPISSPCPLHPTEP